MLIFKLFTIWVIFYDRRQKLEFPIQSLIKCWKCRYWWTLWLPTDWTWVACDKKLLCHYTLFYCPTLWTWIEPFSKTLRTGDNQDYLCFQNKISKMLFSLLLFYDQVLQQQLCRNAIKYFVKKNHYYFDDTRNSVFVFSKLLKKTLLKLC